MVEIAVSFYSEPNAKSRTRRVSFPRVAKSQLHEAICETMRGSEFFACYLAPEGGVIALDRQGIDQRLTALLPAVNASPPGPRSGGFIVT